MKLLKWSAIAVLVLAVLLGAYMWWVVASFDAQTLPANHGKVAVELYAGNERSEGAKRPLLVGLGGAEGGNAWTSRAWKEQRERFIEQGYAVLALGYFGAPGTPEKLDRISLDGIHAAILEAARDPRVDGRCVALIGGSRGGEAALLLASHYPDIDAVVALVPGSAVFASGTDAMVTPAFSLHDRPLPFVPVPWSTTGDLLTGNLRGAFETMMEDTEAMQRAAIAVEKINGPILFVSATRDEAWPSKEMSDAMMQRLRDHRFAHVAEHIPVQGGHNEPLDEFPRIEAFLQSNFAGGCR
ncbi:MAG: alpha/beta fold hydrolase [Pseudomonadota bacterium]|nr:alpha/beta fold hydrolase [Pseudomonadota bacterium]